MQESLTLHQTGQSFIHTERLSLSRASPLPGLLIIAVFWYACKNMRGKVAHYLKAISCVPGSSPTLK